MKQFVHLHTHSDYSLLDGACKLDRLLDRAAELEMSALALTDHGNLFGAVQFHQQSVKQGVKPIIGCEVYVAREGRASRSGRGDNTNHLVLLAANATGYANLSRLVSLAYLEGFYYKPRIDKELLAAHSEGLIGLSACLKGIVAGHLAREQFAEAETEAMALADILGKGNFYLELQDHGIDEQRQINPHMIRLARKLGLPVVATNDCHYLTQQDSFAHDVLLCIQTGKTINDPNRMRYKGDQFYFKTAEEMYRIFGEIPEALTATVDIAERCNFTLDTTRQHLPHFEVPADYTVEQYFEKVVREGFDKRMPYLHDLAARNLLRTPIDQYRPRLDAEIQMIRQMQFPSYFLIVWDFIRFARERGIPVGPGRGSAAGSLVSYSLQITDIDPLQYGLLFERFLNPERVSPPDIDIDFCMDRRSEVIDYVTQKYGRENVCQIITFGTMAARGAVRDCGRGLDIPYAEVDRIAKMIPPVLDATLDKALKEVPQLKEAESDARVAQLLEVARRLEGLARHASTHAAGVVIAPRPLIDLVPLFKSNKDEIMTQFAMGDVEKLGLLKMDFLGLATLTIIHNALAHIRRNRGVELNLSTLPLTDEKTFQLFCDGRTDCIFQFESSGMKDILRRLKPDRFEDLIALNALYRPGPIQGGMIDDFIKRRHGKGAARYDSPQMEEILKETYGVIVYQEQVMQVASRLAGFTMGQADELRRAMGKKNADAMVAQRRKFIDGCVANNIKEKTAAKIFELMEQFASYGFNKSHSAAYALLAYQTAYLKSHYSVEFMAAVLTNEMSNTDKMVKYLAECKEMGIRVLPPDINTSDLHFMPDGDGIRFGLAAIKNVGGAAISSILETRKRVGSFTSIFPFCEAVDLRTINKRVLESLIKSGSFDAFGARRSQLMLAVDRAMETAQRQQRDAQMGQRGLFGTSAAEQAASPELLPEAAAWSETEQLAYEKETLGFYVTGHPLSHYAAEVRHFSNCTVESLQESNAPSTVALGALVASIRAVKTKKGDWMAYVRVEDHSGSAEVVIFPALYTGAASFLVNDAAILVRGRRELDESGVRIIATEVLPLKDVWSGSLQSIRIRVETGRCQIDAADRLDSLLRQHPGRCDVQFELGAGQYRVQLVPREPLQVAANADLVQRIEGICGPGSVVVQR